MQPQMQVEGIQGSRSTSETKSCRPNVMCVRKKHVGITPSGKRRLHVLSFWYSFPPKTPMKELSFNPSAFQCGSSRDPPLVCGEGGGHSRSAIS